MAQLAEPYITLADANDYFGIKEPWFSATTDENNNALIQGRVYIDANYSCSPTYLDTDGSGTASDKIQIANAELANLYLTNPTTFFSSSASAGQNLIRNKVKAGSVESDKQYNAGGLGYIDPYPYATSILSNECILSASSIQVAITRQ